MVASRSAVNFHLPKLDMIGSTCSVASMDSVVPSFVRAPILPQPFPCERVTGTGFQVALESFSLSRIRKRDIGHQLPGNVFGRVGRLSGVVVCETLLQVGGNADIALSNSFTLQ